ncbi:MAG: aminomethyl-transferring glycine dehydrogenase [Legionellales bacterium]|nr:aminomethyl-transferring glycine dehydrogenase [Legionellales bacterium]
MPFIPHTEKDIKAMLAACGKQQLDDLFSEIPSHLQITELPNIDDGISEAELARLMQQIEVKDKYQLCFNGAGAYEHHIPAAVWDIASRGEFMTAYTPYQAEASQGTLQLIYEYQSMMAALMATQVSNASLYDGASALAEAVLMAARIQRKQKQHKVLLPINLNPSYRNVVQSIVGQQAVEICAVDYLPAQGTIDIEQLQQYATQEITAIAISQPNFFGQLEHVDIITNWAHENNILLIAVVNPIAMALITPPGEWGEKGADIICGEGQSLGIPLASGGPYFGFMCTKHEYIRQMPGRIIGKTTDTEGKIGYALTLQAREQHIRRAKATSNICTNQGLAVTAATIYLSLMGYEGLRRIALKSHQNMTALIKMLNEQLGLTPKFTSNYFHEIVLELPVCVKTVRNMMAKRGIEAGVDISQAYPELSNPLLICTTETKTVTDLTLYIDQLADVIHQLQMQKNQYPLEENVAC